MFLLWLQMLLILWLGTTEQMAVLQKKRRFLHLLPQDRDRLVKYLSSQEGSLEDTGLLGSHLLAEVEKQRQTEVPRFLLAHKANAAQGLRNRTSSATPERMQNAPCHPHRKREAELPFGKDAKKFWDLFLLKTKSRSDEIVLPIKTNEMHQETCSAIPFSQTIAHENCEDLVVQNNLCFGRCRSFHVPGLEDRLYSLCSHCLPSKFSMKRLEMNCTAVAAPVIKVLMIVEDCKCEIQRTTEPKMGFLHSGLRAKAYEHK